MSEEVQDSVALSSVKLFCFARGNDYANVVKPSLFAFAHLRDFCNAKDVRMGALVHIKNKAAIANAEACALVAPVFLSPQGQPLAEGETGAFAADTKREIDRKDFVYTKFAADARRDIGRGVVLAVDTLREAVALENNHVTLRVETRRSLCGWATVTGDTMRHVVADTVAPGDAMRHLVIDDVGIGDTARVLANENYKPVTLCVDTKRVLSSIPTVSLGYAECNEIDLGDVYDVSVVLNISGTGYAKVRYADDSHSFSEYEAYRQRVVTCRYIQVQLCVRGYIDGADIAIVAPQQEETQTVEVPTEGAQVAFEHNYYNVPSVFPSYSPNKVVISDIAKDGCFVKMTDEKGEPVAGTLTLLVKG